MSTVLNKYCNFHPVKNTQLLRILYWVKITVFDYFVNKYMQILMFKHSFRSQ